MTRSRKRVADDYVNDFSTPSHVADHVNVADYDDVNAHDHGKKTFVT